MRMRLSDMLLFPREMYLRLSGKKWVLIPGVIFIGIADMMLLLIDKYFVIFKNKEQSIINRNILLAALFIIALGIVDAAFFSLPLFDIFKLFGKEENPPLQENQLVKLLKIYIMAHFITVPVELILYVASLNISVINTGLIYLLVFLQILLPFWYSAAIARGINAIYRFQPVFKALVFIAVFVWSYLLSYALSYMAENWLLPLFG